ncbi:MAG TPA: hypothetical protein VEX88_15580 [Glaciibacter sp.]|nr:hypothetical protein [Glaciibacter sp.]
MPPTGEVRMATVWVAGWRAFWQAVPNVFRGRRRRTFLSVVALGLVTGVAVSAIVYRVGGPGVGGSPYLAVFICVFAVTAAAAGAARVFSLRDRTSQWWIAGTHETTMKQVLAASQSGSLDTVNPQDLTNARRAAELLTHSVPATIVSPLIAAVGAIPLLVLAAAEGSGWLVLIALCVFLAQALEAVSGLLTLGRATLITMIATDRPTAR